VSIPDSRVDLTRLNAGNGGGRDVGARSQGAHSQACAVPTPLSMVAAWVMLLA
jgi:hypothetical protein